jgi:hypothetical protein
MTSEGSEADEAADEGQEGFVDVGAAFVAESEAPVLAEPGEGALDDPAFAAEVGSVLGVAFADEPSDPAGAQGLSVWLGVVAPVGEECVGGVVVCACHARVGSPRRAAAAG